MKKVFLIVILICLTWSGCAPSSPIPPPNPSQEYDESHKKYVSQALAASSETPPEQNSTDMVDYLYLLAEKDAETASQSNMQNAAHILAEAFLDDPWKDNETMESVMYYGSLLYCAYKHDETTASFAELGFDAYRCVKYVYRGAEAPADAQIAFDQVIDGMLELGILTRRAE